jgi:uncharacterized metal-binding protein YceD (DUF177 family)
MLVDIPALMQRGGSFRATVPVKAFARLGAALGEAGDADAVDVALEFRRDKAGRTRVVGKCRMRATVLCSGCAEAVAVRLETALDFRIAASEAEAERLMPDVDAVVLDENRATLAALVEDDLLLGLPEQACAEQRCCPHALALVVEGAGDAVPDGPFAALAALKRTGAGKQTQK